MIRLEMDGLDYVGPELSGPAARALLMKVGPVLPLVIRPEDAGIPLASAWRVLGVPKPEALLLETFKGWTAGEEEITREWLDALPPDRLMEPWIALVAAWGQLGFIMPGWATAAGPAISPPNPKATDTSA